MWTLIHRNLLDPLRLTDGILSGHHRRVFQQNWKALNLSFHQVVLHRKNHPRTQLKIIQSKFIQLMIIRLMIIQLKISELMIIQLVIIHLMILHLKIRVNDI